MTYQETHDLKLRVKAGKGTAEDEAALEAMRAQVRAMFTPAALEIISRSLAESTACCREFEEALGKSPDEYGGHPKYGGLTPKQVVVELRAGFTGEAALEAAYEKQQRQRHHGVTFRAPTIVSHHHRGTSRERSAPRSTTSSSSSRTGATSSSSASRTRPRRPGADDGADPHPSGLTALQRASACLGEALTFARADRRTYETFLDILVIRTSSEVARRWAA
jgi:hypothetical protein